MKRGYTPFKSAGHMYSVSKAMSMNRTMRRHKDNVKKQRAEDMKWAKSLQDRKKKKKKK